MADQALMEYIERLIAQGYTHEQIRETLQKHGYPKSLVNDCLKNVGKGTLSVGQPSGIDPLDAYLQQYLSQGYNLAQLRSYLLTQGHSRREVDTAIRRVTGSTVTHEVHFHLGAVLALLLIVVAGFGGFLYWQGIAEPEEPVEPEPEDPVRLLDLQVTLDQASALPGEKVTPTITVINMGDRSTYDVHLDVALIDADGITWTSVEFTRAITTSVETTRPFLIPDEVPPGNYELKVVAKYGGEMPAIASSPLRVRGEPGSTPPTTPPPSTDPQPVLPPGDETVGFDEAVEEATTLAGEGNRQGASEACAQLEGNARDVCFSTLVLVDAYPPYCEVIASQQEKENCYMVFVLQGDVEYCDKMQTAANRNQCSNLKLLYELSENVPQPAAQPLPEGAHVIEDPDLNDFAEAAS